MRTFAIVVLLSVVVPVTAQKTPPPPPTCSTTPTFTVTPGNPVELTFSHLTDRELGSTRVSISGSQIIVHQLLIDGPPPPTTATAVETCNIRTVSLGDLPAGIYSVTWNYSIPSGVTGGTPVPSVTFTFQFAHLPDVPALSGPMLAALVLLLGSLGVILMGR